MEERIDGLTLAEVKYNIYAFGRDMRNFARKVERARLDHTRAKWQKKYANAKGYLEDNQERLARFEAVEQCVHPTGSTCQHPRAYSVDSIRLCPDCNSVLPASG